MSDVFEILAKLREQYPDAEDLEAIQEDENRIKALFKRKDFAMREEVQELTATLRSTVVTFKTLLATDRNMTQHTRDQIWAGIDARLEVLSILAIDFDSEIEAISAQLEAKLTV